MSAASARPDLEAFRGVDFNWAIRLEDVSRAPAADVPELHRNARREILDELARLHGELGDASPLGRFIVGEGGSGKTHLLTAIRHAVAGMGLGFILVNMTDVRDFWETVAQGYLNSLQATYLDNRPQYVVFLKKLLAHVPLKHDVQKALDILARQKPDSLKKEVGKALQHLQKAFPTRIRIVQDVIRALVCLNSADFSISSAGLAWLQGLEMDDALRGPLGFRKPRESPREIVRAFSWLMSLAGPSVLAFDQLDPIVHEVARQNATTDADEQNTARRIIDQIGNGLAAIRETTARTLVLVSCLEPSYGVLAGEVLASNLDRFHPPTRLQNPGPAVYQALIETRLTAHYRQHGIVVPYASWPITRAAIDGLRGQSPRRVFQLCEAHRRRCIELGRVEELTSFGPAAPLAPTAAADRLRELDEEFRRCQEGADLAALRDANNENDRLAPLYRVALQCLIHEHAQDLPPAVDACVETEFGGDKSNPPLHARLRLQFQDQDDREEHYCVRVLLNKNHTAYRSRLKSAITQSGIDKKLHFRRLTVVRFDAPPTGAATQKLTEEFRSQRGHFHYPDDEELRCLSALAALARSKNPEFHAWLARTQPVSRLNLGHVLAAGSLFDPDAPAPGQNGHAPPVKPPSAQANIAPAPVSPTSRAGQAPNQTPSSPISPRSAATPIPTRTGPPSSILLGHRVIGDQVRGALTLPAPLLEKHTFIVAGAGSGKTVLLKRLVEEAALAGIPSIVIDGANDLATLGEPWPSPPADCSPEQRDRAREYFDRVEVVVWTPGVERGNPVRLQPLPDFAAVRDDPEALEESIQVAVEGLSEYLGAGAPATREKKIGILRRVLAYFASEGGGTLEALIALLSEPPQEVRLGIEKEDKLARDIADTLKVCRENNPLLRSAGAPLDPASLFGDAQPTGKTRVSVINLAGLGGPANQQQFLNQLGMTLFDWAKKNPHPPGRALRGLFLLDEAKDFAPSRSGTACKRSLMRCVAQLRKYHIGMVFATQNPKDLDNTIGGNCSTHFYGKVNSPVAIETVKELLAGRGAAGHDIGNLPRGLFYVHNADADCKTPTKIKIPMCLTHHRASPPGPDEIIALAERFRPPS